ncbi:dolichyl-diphosphooligosaccharide--protein glycosyltransferase subunit 1B-like [Zingiber officinale]|uniref:dolichyl-diphosphooligosaccharide--protein glycosyltransferase subunit 1B-like n=1 Tax=Zingiber officinale TaxID=94328 RepID=UPI001C4AF315|nr:dolichyl-diphosphooligosaccharide--protein glycosyltransferase subunit 1B-like [Zingiber officinale]
MGRRTRSAAAMAIVPLLLLSFFHLLQFVSSTQEIRVLSAEKRIDLTSPIARVFLTLKVENYGAPEVPEILIAFSPTESEHLAILKASTVEGKRKKKTYVPLSVSPVSSPDAPNGAQLYSVTLRSPLQSGEMTTVETLYVLTHSLEPFPTEISQSEPQLVYYRDSATILSPYTIVEQTVYIKTPSSKVESYTKVEPTARSGSETRYGPYHDRLPYSFSPVIVHFENNNPFAVVEELVREIEISHWGNLQIRDHYRLKHAGARHKGVFSRLDYQFRQSLSASFKTLLAMLPPRVHSVYYRDDIGNISSSHLRINSQKSELEIEPRYPLFGGWKATFTIGYGLPLQDFLFESSDGRRYLNFSFGCPLIETVVDDLTVKVILPEGSRNPTAAVPFPVNQHLETTYSYLDVVGRTTLVLQKRNVVPEHNYPFQVYYDFNPIFMLAEPLMLVSSVFLFFVAYIAYVHIDLSIRRPLKTNS